VANMRPATTRTVRRRSLPATVAAIASLSAVGFAGIFGGLWHQMAATRDPALGPKARALAATANQPVSRRIVRRTIIVRKVRDRGAPPAAGAPVPVQPQPATDPPPPPPPVVTKVS
jgi:hypothetical protein